jgi:general secretion pathway protein D
VIRLARQILEAADRTDSEVVFDLELVEVSHRDVLDLGPKLSSYSISAGFGQSFIDSDGNVVTELVNDTLSAGGATENLVRSFSSLESFYTLPTATFDFAKTLTDSEILANPKIRVKNREKAKVHIGTREPVVTTNISTTTGDVTSTNVQYIDVGVKLDVAPSIQLDDTIVTTIKLEVSSVLEKEEIAGGGVALRLSTTNAESALILKDGERTIIGGLIRDDLSNTRSTLPLLGDIPIIGQLFTHRGKEKRKREILLSITPHIVRAIDLPRPEVATIWSGSEDDPSDGPRFAAFASDFRTPAEVLEGEASPAGEAEPGEVAPSPPENGATLHFSGPPMVAVGQEFHVELMVAGVRDLHQAVATVAYPPHLFELVAAQRGPLFGRDQGAVQFTMTPAADRGQATLELRREQQRSGVSGSGPLFSLVFRGKAAGNGVLRLIEFALRDRQGQVMDVEARAFSVEVR